ncbi:hypothetical protein [Methylobacter svalbardensis]|uniref:hypothetical protein n=1 Tax=Methylobacter svalbardensis TaxID=3080016 RepID=UPI0030EE074A
MYFNTGKHTIKKVTNNGGNIVLDDNSNWDVSLFDKFTALFWSPNDKVTVKPYIGSKFKIERETRFGKIEIIEAAYLN